LLLSQYNNLLYCASILIKNNNKINCGKAVGLRIAAWLPSYAARGLRVGKRGELAALGVLWIYNGCRAVEEAATNVSVRYYVSVR